MQSPQLQWSHWSPILWLRSTFVPSFKNPTITPPPLETMVCVWFPSLEASCPRFWSPLRPTSHKKSFSHWATSPFKQPRQHAFPSNALMLLALWALSASPLRQGWPWRRCRGPYITVTFLSTAAARCLCSPNGPYTKQLLTQRGNEGRDGEIATARRGKNGKRDRRRLEVRANGPCVFCN